MLMDCKQTYLTFLLKVLLGTRSIFHPNLTRTLARTWLFSPLATTPSSPTEHLVSIVLVISGSHIESHVSFPEGQWSALLAGGEVVAARVDTKETREQVEGHLPWTFLPL